jgi:hypothetical protein
MPMDVENSSARPASFAVIGMRGNISCSAGFSET